MVFHADYSDQTDFFDPSKFGTKLTMIGCGGIGATALPTLATLGVTEVIVWDDDIVKPRNVTTTTIFGPDDVGQPKVEVVARELKRLGVRTVTTHYKKFDPNEHGQSLDGIVLSGVDSMQARKSIWQALAYNGMVPLYFDGRIGGEILQLNIVNPCDVDDIEWYTKFQLFDDANAAPLPCAARTVVYPSVVLGGLITSRLSLYFRGLPLERQFTVDMKTMNIIMMMRPEAVE